jgi:hypothetical protein
MATVPTAAETARAQIEVERERLSKRQRYLAIVEKMVESWTEEQTEAMLAMSEICQAAAQQRLAALRPQMPMPR